MKARKFMRLFAGVLACPVAGLKWFMNEPPIDEPWYQGGIICGLWVYSSWFFTLALGLPGPPPRTVVSVVLLWVVIHTLDRIRRLEKRMQT